MNSFNYIYIFFLIPTTKNPNLVPGSFSEEFSTGYLLGELLHKYGLQDDFNQFSQSRLVHVDNVSLTEIGQNICFFQLGSANAEWEGHLELLKI